MLKELSAKTDTKDNAVFHISYFLQGVTQKIYGIEIQESATPLHYYTKF